MSSKNNIIQWNINGVNSHIGELRHLIQDLCPYVICLQETLLRENQNHNINGYNIYRTDGISDRRARGGVATYVNSNFQSEEIILNNTDLEVVLIKLFFPIEFYICNIYLPPNLVVRTNDLNNILRQIPGDYLLIGDFNAHTQMWGSNHIDARGQIIENLIVSNNLNLMNNNQPTHFNISNGTTSIIDLTICSPRINIYFEFEVIADLSGSDHFPININIISNNMITNETKRRRWILERADWISFQRETKFDRDLLSLSVNEIYNHIQD